MGKPTQRANLPVRQDGHRNRRLDENPQAPAFAQRFANIRYGCYGKHKSNPHIYGVAPYHGPDSDRSLCDEHAGFTQRDMPRIQALFLRSEQAGLAGSLIWTVDNTGWIYELQSTNVGLNEWHGYPILPNDDFAEKVWRRFSDWALAHGNALDKGAADACAQIYGLRR